MKVQISYGKSEIGPYKGLWWVRVETIEFGCIMSVSGREDGPEQAERYAELFRNAEVEVREDTRGKIRADGKWR